MANRTRQALVVRSLMMNIQNQNGPERPRYRERSAVKAATRSASYRWRNHGG